MPRRQAPRKNAKARSWASNTIASGCDGAFRAGVTALGLTYAVGVHSTLSVWPPGEAPLPPKS